MAYYGCRPQTDKTNMTPSRPLHDSDTHRNIDATTLTNKTTHEIQDNTRTMLLDDDHFTTLTTDNANQHGHDIQDSRDDPYDATTLSEYFMTLTSPRYCDQNDHFTTHTATVLSAKTTSQRSPLTSSHNPNHRRNRDVPGETISTRSKEPSDLVGWRRFANHA
ncbi:hypothetical protein CY34DRAFT_404484 [Suillus luteus UH-Slu-Lm8-n1]|uniref:Uncharacterized protein n=1 Tax=Suillus luteus UH-Slu-Lm8-n1 TaxID=930992 RepID=A0A0D0A917_9AGAM|nr:hypothetical protein CY34DRAFT_404484 [Suillus luteus UH-Slu-Lm8-n1]